RRWTFAARQVAHAFLHVTAQTRQRSETTLGKHNRDLFEVVADYVDGVEFCAQLVGDGSRELRRGNGRWAEVCRQQNAVQADLRESAAVFDEVVLRRSDREDRARRLRD